MPCTLISGLKFSAFVAVAFLFGSLSSTGAAAAWNFEKLLMPGELIEGHAEYESDCANCHVSFEKSAQNSLCLDCHEAVATDVEQGMGFHGSELRTGEADCKACHVDHQGRQHDIVKLDIDSFNHLFTDFPLEGKHRDVSCQSCHKVDRKYSETPGDCVDCHENDDRHDGSLGVECTDCHSVSGWQKAEFDHASTRFLLQGKHADVSCDACHPDDRYKDIAMQCNSCHAINDIHGGRHGAECENCHSEKQWDAIQFDHASETDFALLGGHKPLKCESCHKGSQLDETAGNLCIDCHRNDDIHSGKNGEACQDCHGESSWEKTIFQHERDANFPLAGKHAELLCGACHAGPLYDEVLQTECINCHAHQDVHKGEQGRVCSNCHSEQGWNRDVAFDHDLTDFPLIGLHAPVPCEECHFDGSFESTAADCNACHTVDDEHNGTLGTNCYECHSPGGWDLWRFDHNSQTEYPLEGAHENLACGACHTRKVTDKVRQSSLCIACHRDDDIHAGSYSDRCDRCHTIERFDDVQKLWR